MKTIPHPNTAKFNPTAFRAEVALHVLPGVIAGMDQRDVTDWAVHYAYRIADDYMEHLQYTAERDAKYAAGERAERKKAKQAVKPTPTQESFAFSCGGAS